MNDAGQIGVQCSVCHKIYHNLHGNIRIQKNTIDGNYYCMDCASTASNGTERREDEIRTMLADVSGVIGLAEGLAENDSWFAERRNADEIITKAKIAIISLTGATAKWSEEIESLKKQMHGTQSVMDELLETNRNLAALNTKLESELKRRGNGPVEDDADIFGSR